MAKARAMTESQSAERRAAAKRLRGLFGEVAPGRSLADELIAERRADVDSLRGS
jgi:hypothetical protein